MEFYGSVERWNQREDGTWWYRVKDADPKYGKPVWISSFETTCGECGESLVVPRSRYLHAQKVSQTLFCSRACAGKALPKTRKKWVGRPRGPEGGRFVAATGYVYLWLTDDDGRRRSFAEHRVVMERHIGRKLHKGETVHHKNGDRQDNRIENLELWASYHHSGQRVTEGKPHCGTCTCFDH